MKYSRLTKEQFEELHQEFINFLATQSVTADEWANLKVNKPELAETELDVFSDLISIFRFDKLSIVVDTNNNNKISQIIIVS